MTTIRFIAMAGVFDFEQIDPETGDSGLFVEDPKILQSLDGLSYSDEMFADYLADGQATRSLAEMGVGGGFLRFEYDEKAQKLMAVTEYSLPRRLDPSEIEVLKTYTIGQWSDGIGSNFFQERMSEGLAPQALVVSDEQIRVEHRS